MKKLYTIVAFIVLAFSSNVLFAQDRIETNGGHTYEVKILEETDEYIEFYFLHDEDKEVRKMSMQNIGKITKNAWEAITKDEMKSSISTNGGDVKDGAKTTAVKEGEIKESTTNVKEKESSTVASQEEKKATVLTPEPKKQVAEKKKPIQVKEENDIKCLYVKDDGKNKITKSLYFNSTNINSAPITLLKKFTLKGVKGVKEGDKMYLVFTLLGDNNFSMKSKNKVLIKLTNGSVVDLYNSAFTAAEYKSRYEAQLKIEVPEFHLSDLIEHKALRFRFILDNGYIEFTNNARTSHWLSRALLCVS